MSSNVSRRTFIKLGVALTPILGLGLLPKKRAEALELHA